ncbi:hypothetical protein AALA36_20210 [Lachnospiraceae bacterium 66-29]
MLKYIWGIKRENPSGYGTIKAKVPSGVSDSPPNPAILNSPSELAYIFKLSLADSC